MGERIVGTLDTRGVPKLVAESDPVEWGGGPGYLMVRNVTGIGVCTLQVLEPVTQEWIDTDIAIKGDGIKAFTYPLETQARVRLTRGSPSAVVAHIIREPRHHYLRA